MSGPLPADVLAGLARVVDERAIVDLTIRYCSAIDGRRFEELRDVFLPDAVADYGRVGTCEGVDAIMATCARALGPLDASQHLVTNHQVQVHGAQASAQCSFQAQHVRHGVEGGPNLIVAGTYTDELVRTDAGWRIRHRTLTVVWTDGNPDVTGRAGGQVAGGRRRAGAKETEP